MLMRKIVHTIANTESRVVGINRRNIDLIYPNNPRKEFQIADDKVFFKQTLSKQDVPVPTTYAIIEHLWEVDSKLKELESLESLVIKPARGSGGQGIMILHKNKKGWLSLDGKHINQEQLRMHMASILYGAYSHDRADKVIVEEMLTPDPFHHRIYDSGIPDIRIIMYQDRPVMAMLRVPTSHSRGKANLHQGAIGIGIDMDRGELGEGVYKGRLIQVHPDSGVRFSGMKLPHWGELIRISCQTASLVPLKFLGIDLILDSRHGPLVIEINARPGLQIQNANRQGLMEILENTKSSRP